MGIRAEIQPYTEDHYQASYLSPIQNKVKDPLIHLLSWIGPYALASVPLPYFSATLRIQTPLETRLGGYCT